MNAEEQVFSDHQGRAVRLTGERWQHILEHPEMVDQQARLAETLAAPDAVVATVKDESVHAYHRLYEQTPVTRKYLVVVVKTFQGDAFVLTAFFSSRQKRGEVTWPR